MSDGYDPNSCNALQRPFYRPVEAAIRWCNLIQHEAAILQALSGSPAPTTEQFPQWPCLKANTEKILDAIVHGELTCGRDGRPVAADDHVAPGRRTVRHTDLREWMAKYHPGSKPAFLFDEVERAAHSAINADSFRALQIDRDAALAELERVRTRANETTAERDALRGECESLRATVDRMGAPSDRAEATYLNIIGALLELVLGRTPSGKPHSVFASQAAVIDALLAQQDKRLGISKTTLEAKFAEARRRLNST